MSNLLAKVEKNNPKLVNYETIQRDGDYALIVGKLGEEDNPHYLICNVKYGVIEAGTGTLTEGHKLLAFVSGTEGKVPIKRAQTAFEFN